VPGRAIGVTDVEFVVRASVVREVGEVTVEVAVVQEGMADRIEHAGLVLSEEIGGDEIYGLPRLAIMRIVPPWVVPSRAVDDLLRRQPEEEEVLLAGFATRASGTRKVRKPRYCTCSLPGPGKCLQAPGVDTQNAPDA
jgi:hypothetical protein